MVNHLDFDVFLDDRYKIFKKRNPTQVEFMVIPNHGKTALAIRYNTVYKKFFIININRKNNEHTILGRLSKLTNTQVQNFCKIYIPNI